MIPKIKEGDFYESINRAIAEKRHVNYLKSCIKNFENYKKFFELALTDKNPEMQIYTFKVKYLLQNSVWRVFEICGCQYLDELANAIIDSMDWENDHMHGFSFPDPMNKAKRFGSSPFVIFGPEWEDDPHPTFKSDEVRIENVDYTKYPKLGFIFDFGDGHEFDIEMIGMRPIEKKEIADDFPKLTDIRGVGPEQYPPCDDEDEPEFEEIDAEEVKERKREVEDDLKDLLKQTKSDFDIKYIKNIIYNEVGEGDLTKVIAVFDRGGDFSEMSNILDLATDAWNYFPHKSLGGKSPAEKALAG